MYGVRSSVIYSSHIDLQIGSGYVPQAKDDDVRVYNFALSGPNIDYDKISTSNEEFAKPFYSLTKRTYILFGDIISVSKYRLVEQAFTCGQSLSP
jgi:hypothetical protein